jgi:hypothetical protein
MTKSVRVSQALPNAVAQVARAALCVGMCACVGVVGSGCGAPADTEAVTAAISDAVVDHLACQDTLRPATLARLQAALTDPGLDTVQALVLAPEDLASAVAVAGPQAEAAVVVARTLWMVVDSGVGPRIVSGEWDGLHCDDVVPVPCTAGTASSVVVCDDGPRHGDGIGRDVEVIQSFDRCTLRGVILDGDVRLSRTNDDGVLRADLEKLAIDDRNELSGAFAVVMPADHSDVDADLDNSLSLAGLSARIIEPIIFKSHGGLDGGLSCGEELDLDTLGIDVATEATRVAIAGAWNTPERSVGVVTGDGGLRFDGACACPTGGSGVSFEIPRPLGRDDQTALAHVAWHTPTASDGDCAIVTVDVDGWPTSCGGLEGVGSDCGAGAVQATMQALLQAMCTTR